MLVSDVDVCVVCPMFVQVTYCCCLIVTIGGVNEKSAICTSAPVETTVTTIESAAYTPSESCALMTTCPALSPHTSTEVPEDSAGITRRGNSGPPQAVAGRATRVSTAGITDRKTVLGAESVRLNVNGTDTLPPLPTESESLGTPHRSNAGGAATTFTRVESL